MEPDRHPDESRVLDRRVARSKERVLAETHRMLSEAGIGGVSIDEVSRRSGVSKTTIYRHWATRSALLIDACSTMSAPQPAPETGSVAGDLMALAQSVGEQLRTATWPAVLPSIVDAAERDPEIARMHTGLQAGMMQPFVRAIDAAKARGELASDRDTATLLAEIVGPLFFRRWFSSEAVDGAFVTRIVEHALR